jgi:chorismate mutase
MDFLDKKRKEIDNLDKKLIKILEKRFKTVKEIVKWKRKKEVLVEDLQRENRIKDKYKRSKLPKGFSDKFFDYLFKEAKKEDF